MRNSIIGLLLLIGSLLGAHSAFAESGTISQLSPWVVSGGYIKSASSTAGLWVQGLTNCNTIDTDSTGHFSCGVDGGGGDSYPFSPNNATTSIVGFLGGMFAVGSSTIQDLHATNFTLGTLSGGLGANNGVVYAGATTTFTGATGLTYANGNVTCDVATGSVPGCLAAADWTIFNNKASFAYPFTNGSGYFATTTGGIFNASTTAQYFNSASSSIDVLRVNTRAGVATSTPGQGAAFGVTGDVFFSGEVFASNVVDSALTGTSCVGESSGLLNTNNCVTSIGQTYGSAQNGVITFASSTTAISGDWGLTNSGGTFTFNIPSSSASNRGLLTSADWTTFNNKESSLGSITGLIGSNGTTRYQVSTSTLNIGGTALNVTGIVAAATGGTGTSTVPTGDCQILISNALSLWSVGSINGGTGMTSSCGGSNYSETRTIGLNLASNLTWTGTETFGQLAYTNATGTSIYASASSTFQVLNVGTLAVSDVTFNGLTDFTSSVVTIEQQWAFSIATTTGWIGTTTRAIGPAYSAQTWKGVKCFTDTGTLQVSFSDGTNRMNWFNASTTVGAITLSTNNTFSLGEKRYVDIGTPASSPTAVSCSVSVLIND